MPMSLEIQVDRARHRQIHLANFFPYYNRWGFHLEVISRVPRWSGGSLSSLVKELLFLICIVEDIIRWDPPTREIWGTSMSSTATLGFCGSSYVALTKSKSHAANSFFSTVVLMFWINLYGMIFSQRGEFLIQISRITSRVPLHNMSRTWLKPHPSQEHYLFTVIAPCKALSIAWRVYEGILETSSKMMKSKFL